MLVYTHYFLKIKCIYFCILHRGGWWLSCMAEQSQTFLLLWKLSWGCAEFVSVCRRKELCMETFHMYCTVPQDLEDILPCIVTRCNTVSYCVAMWLLFNNATLTYTKEAETLDFNTEIKMTAYRWVCYKKKYHAVHTYKGVRFPKFLMIFLIVLLLLAAMPFCWTSHPLCHKMLFQVELYLYALLSILFIIIIWLFV